MNGTGTVAINHRRVTVRISDNSVTNALCGPDEERARPDLQGRRKVFLFQSRFRVVKYYTVGRLWRFRNVRDGGTAAERVSAKRTGIHSVGIGADRLIDSVCFPRASLPRQTCAPLSTRISIVSINRNNGGFGRVRDFRRLQPLK